MSVPRKRDVVQATVSSAVGTAVTTIDGWSQRFARGAEELADEAQDGRQR